MTNYTRYRVFFLALQNKEKIKLVNLRTELTFDLYLNYL